MDEMAICTLNKVQVATVDTDLNTYTGLPPFLPHQPSPKLSPSLPEWMLNKQTQALFQNWILTPQKNTKKQNKKTEKQPVS